MREKGFELLGAAACGQVNIWGNQWKMRVIAERVRLCRFKLVLSALIRVDFLLQERGKGDAFTKRNLMPCLKADKQREKSFFCICFFSVAFSSK